MNDTLVEDRGGGLQLSSSSARIDVDPVLAMLVVSHWGGAMTRRGWWTPSFNGWRP
ncbi:MAG: hypothetical protein ABI442_09420 [Gemmatimonadaceae bacterium]